MIKKITILALPILIFSCGETTQENLSPDKNISATTGDTCDCNELDIDSSGLHQKDEKPFTGTCISYYENTDSKYLEKNLLNGKLHGEVDYYDKSGNIILTEFYENGVAKRNVGSDVSNICDCSELEIKVVQGYSVYQLDNVPYTGKCEKKYPDSDQLSMESNYKNGLLEGYTLYYDKSGNTILMEKYEQGELVSAVH